MDVREKDFMSDLREIEPSSMREIMVEIPEVSWGEVGGLEDIKEKLMDFVQRPLDEPESFEKLGISPPKGILLYGPPGTGKTLLGKAVANECDANFISIKGPEILSKWVGESEKAVREIFKKARQTAPSIIFLDEIDSLAPERGMSEQNVATDRVVNQLLTSLDGIESSPGIVVLAATNRPDRVDSALLRAGRFDHKLFVSVPHKKSRLEIFKIHTSHMPLADDVDLENLAQNTESFVGADIKTVCREAGLSAIKKKKKVVQKEDFEKALEGVHPSIDEDILEMYQEMKLDMEKTFRKKKDYNGVGLYR